MPNHTSRFRCGAEAVRWLREYLNSGACMSALAMEDALVLEERHRIRFRAYREIEGTGEVSKYHHEADVSLLRAEFLRIDLDGETFGTISSAVFEEGDTMRLEILLAAGGLSIEFDALQVSERLAPVYEMKR